MFRRIHPFDMGFRQRQQERLKTQTMRLAGGFHPPSLSQAKGDVSVNYYLNSPDAETLEAEAEKRQGVTSQWKLAAAATNASEKEKREKAAALAARAARIDAF